MVRSFANQSCRLKASRPEIEQFERSWGFVNVLQQVPGAFNKGSLILVTGYVRDVQYELRNPSFPKLSGPLASSIQAEHGPLQSREADSLLLGRFLADRVRMRSLGHESCRSLYCDLCNPTEV